MLHGLLGVFPVRCSLFDRQLTPQFPGWHPTKIEAGLFFKRERAAFLRKAVQALEVQLKRFLGPAPQRRCCVFFLWHMRDGTGRLRICTKKSGAFCLLWRPQRSSQDFETREILNRTGFLLRQAFMARTPQAPLK